MRIQIYETEQGWLAGQLWEKQEKEEEKRYGPAAREEGLGESAWRKRGEGGLLQYQDGWKTLLC